MSERGVVQFWPLLQYTEAREKAKSSTAAICRELQQSTTVIPSIEMGAEALLGRGAGPVFLYVRYSAIRKHINVSELSISLKFWRSQTVRIKDLFGFLNQTICKLKFFCGPSFQIIAGSSPFFIAASNLHFNSWKYLAKDGVPSNLWKIEITDIFASLIDLSIPHTWLILYYTPCYSFIDNVFLTPVYRVHGLDSAMLPNFIFHLCLQITDTGYQPYRAKLSSLWISTLYPPKILQPSFTTALFLRRNILSNIQEHSHPFILSFHAPHILSNPVNFTAKRIINKVIFKFDPFCSSPSTPYWNHAEPRKS